MPRKPNIKWRESDAEKLAKEIKRFNDKVTRTRRKHPELASILPETIKKADKAKMIEELKASPRSEFNKTLHSLERFSRKGAEQAISSKTGLTVTKWEKGEVGLKVQQINRERAKERQAMEQVDVTSRGQPVGLKRGEMGSERMNALKPKKFNFDVIKPGKEWQKFKESVNRQAKFNNKNLRMELYKQNYIKSLRGTFGDYANEIIKIVERVPAETMVKTYFSEQEAVLGFIYEPQHAEFKLEVLKDIWQGVLDAEDNEVNS
jgi:hypothetical protein